MLLPKPRHHTSLPGLNHCCMNITFFKSLYWVFIAITYFIIHESLVIPKIHCYMHCHFEQTTKLWTELTYQLFYSLSRVLFFKNPCSKTSGLLLIFICVSTGHAYFQNNEICIPGSPKCLLRCIQLKNTTRKAGFKVCGKLLHPFFNSEKKPAFEQKFICVQCNTGIIWAPLPHNGLLSWAWKDTQINIRTNTHFFRKQFQ